MVIEAVTRDPRQRKHIATRFCQLSERRMPEHVRLERFQFLCAFLLSFRVGTIKPALVLILGGVFVQMAFPR